MRGKCKVVRHFHQETRSHYLLSLLLKTFLEATALHQFYLCLSHPLPREQLFSPWPFFRHPLWLHLARSLPFLSCSGAHSPNIFNAQGRGMSGEGVGMPAPHGAKGGSCRPGDSPCCLYPLSRLEGAGRTGCIRDMLSAELQRLVWLQISDKAKRLAQADVSGKIINWLSRPGGICFTGALPALSPQDGFSLWGTFSNDCRLFWLPQAGGVLAKGRGRE